METRHNRGLPLADGERELPPGSVSPLAGQVALVTGGSRGIGRAIALRLAREGPRHIVLGYALDHQAARRTVAEVEALGVEASAVAADLSRPELVRGMFATVEERCGRLDIFVSNAARASFLPVRQLTVRAWQRIVDLNTRAFLLGAQLAAEIMRRNGGGRIVALSSQGAATCLPGYAGLGAAKAAIESLARYLAVELAPLGINVNVVSGGFVDTESTRRLPDYERVKEQIAARTPGGRVGRPEDLAGIVWFLCSAEADWIRGQVLVADGGLSLVGQPLTGAPA